MLKFKKAEEEERVARAEAREAAAEAREAAANDPNKSPSQYSARSYETWDQGDAAKDMKSEYNIPYSGSHSKLNNHAMRVKKVAVCVRENLLLFESSLKLHENSVKFLSMHAYL